MEKANGVTILLIFIFLILITMGINIAEQKLPRVTTTATPIDIFSLTG